MQFFHLLGTCLAAQFLHREDRSHGAGMAHERPGTHTTQLIFRIFRDLPFRPFGCASLGCGNTPFPFRRLPFRPLSAIQTGHTFSRAQAVEHVAHFLRHDLAHDLGHALAEGDPTPLGVVLDRIGTVVIRGHVLGAVARQGTGEAVGIGKIVAALMQIHAVAVPR